MKKLLIFLLLSVSAPIFCMEDRRPEVDTYFATHKFKKKRYRRNEMVRVIKCENIKKKFEAAIRESEKKRSKERF